MPGTLRTASGRILVVLPTLGERLGTLAQTLESIDAQRDEVDLRLVVVLPTGAVEAASLAAAHGADIVDDPGLGMSEAINAGVRAADDETYYAWMGDDDLFRPHGLRRLRALFDLDPRAIVAFGACEHIGPDGQVIGRSAAGRIAPWLMTWGPNLVPHPGSMIRLDALHEVGPFDATLKYAMDLDMFLRLHRLGRFASTRQTVSAFRWHPDSLTVSNREASVAESQAVRRRHLPAWLRPVAPAWENPWRWAGAVAGSRRSQNGS